ncbi:16047_t:CDS:2, partial [Gigaspora margarita]
VIESKKTLCYSFSAIYAAFYWKHPAIHILFELHWNQKSQISPKGQDRRKSQTLPKEQDRSKSQILPKEQDQNSKEALRTQFLERRARQLEDFCRKSGLTSLPDFPSSTSTLYSYYPVPLRVDSLSSLPCSGFFDYSGQFVQDYSGAMSLSDSNLFLEHSFNNFFNDFAPSFHLQGLK